MLLWLGACTATSPARPEDQTAELLTLVTQVIESSSPEQRRGIEQAQRRRFDAEGTYNNLLRLTLVRAFSAALPSELKQTRADLQALANGRDEINDNHRRLALMVLIMVDQRLQMGAQITDLQQQIDSLTEIEASLNDNDVNGATELAPQ